MILKTLPIVPDPSEEFRKVEREIIRVFRAKIYLPLIREFNPKRKLIKNAVPGLYEALHSGRITYSKGKFSGRFNSKISKELKELGAKWNGSDKSWGINKAKIPIDLRNQIAITESRFQEKVSDINRRLARVTPDEFSKNFNFDKVFDSTIYKTDVGVRKSLRAITVSPELTTEQRKKISDDWSTNMDLWIKDFTEKEIKRLRKDLERSVLAGNRYETAIGYIKKSYGVTERKAKFLARQETKLLTTALKQTRYVDAGVTKYKWKSVTGTSLHPVRPMHKELNDKSDKGQVFDFRYPPVDDPNGSRHNPGQNYNCRCVAIPVVSF